MEQDTTRLNGEDGSSNDQSGTTQPVPSSDTQSRVEAAQQAEPKSRELPLKDKLSLIISSIALLLSMAGFFYPLYRTSANEVKSERRAQTHAYNLGIAFTLAYIGFTQTTEGNPREIAEAEESAKRFLEQNTREIATALGLSPDLSVYLVKPKRGDVLEGRPFQSLREKISYFNTERTVAAYDLGHGLTYLGAESQYAQVLHKEQEFAQTVYPLYRRLINRSLKVLGADNDEFLGEFDNLESVGRRARQLRDKYDAQFGGSS